MTVEPENAHLCRQSARDQAAAPKPINQSARFLDELQGESALGDDKVSRFAVKTGDSAFGPKSVAMH
ncbi:hypothetical protein [Erythrobacter aurantius]|uniref:hypothetical protein n=1 Tax=Erythrobacter aurantius TaxID=2909249 RepID=UPI00207A4717|nr:hypothetical protein [Erythrobacter aurantius]